jgi:transcriptional regulator with XRE-family HTH domain
MSSFAERLKHLRAQSGLTMQALADEAKVSKSMICKIERDEVQPTLDITARLAKALGTTLSEMLHASQKTRVVFLPKNEQAVWEDAHHVKRRNISPVFEGLKLEWLHMELPAKTSISGPPVTTKGAEKYILVTKGILEIKIDGKLFRLKKGDSLYFETHHLHEWANAGKETVEYYVVIRHS